MRTTIDSPASVGFRHLPASRRTLFLLLSFARKCLGAVLDYYGEPAVILAREAFGRTGQSLAQSTRNPTGMRKSVKGTVGKRKANTVGRNKRPVRPVLGGEGSTGLAD